MRLSLEQVSFQDDMDKKGLQVGLANEVLLAGAKTALSWLLLWRT